MHISSIITAIEAIHEAIVSHESEIESLDRAIGDGDHYINMKRGASTLLDMRSMLSSLTPDAALQQIGMKLLSTIGGASGPLFASFCMSMGKTLKENGSDSTLQLAAAFAAGVQAIVQRGKAEQGEKTMLDVLIPVSTEFTRLASQETPITKIKQTLIETAEKNMLSTRDMLATKGRAAGLGERAIGHIDPGAKSCQVMIAAVCSGPLT